MDPPGFWARAAPSALSFASGLALMVLELVAGRLVAGEVGSSQYTWISIIGVLLAGMSAGNAIGGRLADRHAPLALLPLLFFFAAAMVAGTLALRAAAAPLKEALLPVVLEHPAGSAHLWGLCVLLVTALVFLAPAAALGLLSPAIARLAIDLHGSGARAIGSVSSWGALGAIAGTLLTGFVLLGHFGVATIVGLVAAVLALLGVATGAAWLRSRRRGAALRVAPPKPASAAPRWTPLALVFVASFCLMALEIAAGRLVARHLGSSLYTWTSVIGVVFAGMSLGHYLGGRLAARSSPRRLLQPVLFAASALTFSVLWSHGALGTAEDLALGSDPDYEVRADFGRLHGAGVPNEVLRKLRPLIGLRFADATTFDATVAAVLSPDEHARHRTEILRYARGGSSVPYALRLLLVVLISFFAPSMALGGVMPVAAALALEDARAAGTAVGNVYAFGAWGSILGTLVTGFYLVAALGTHALLAGAALVLALFGVVVARRRFGPTLWLVVLACLSFPVFHQLRGPTALDPEGQGGAGATFGSALRVTDDYRSVDSVESDYQLLRVYREGARSDRPAMRVLSLDHLVHGYVAFRSEPSPAFDPTHLEYDYEKLYAFVTGRAFGRRLAVQGAALRSPPLKALFIGGGSYTFPRFFVETFRGETHTAAPGETLQSIVAARYGESGRRDVEERVRIHNRLPPGEPAPGTKLALPSLADVAELDPAVTAVSASRLFLASESVDPRVKTWSYDARNFVEAAAAGGWRGRYDVVYGDAFNHYSVPYHLTTREMTERIRDVLAPGGVYVLNVIDRFETGAFLSSFGATLRAVFRNVWVLLDGERGRRRGRSTFVLVASDAAISFEGGEAIDVAVLAGKKSAVELARAHEARRTEEVLGPGAGVFGAIGDSRILTDDYAPLDHLLAPLFGDL